MSWVLMILIIAISELFRSNQKVFDVLCILAFAGAINFLIVSMWVLIKKGWRFW